MIRNAADVPILIRREIEAGIAGPLARAFIREMGPEKALPVIQQVFEEQAYQSGRDLAAKLGGNTIADFAKGQEAWQAGGAYDLEILELSENVFNYNITRCSYAEMYERLGMRDLGVLFSCRRDFKLVEGFNPRLKLTRTGTIMEGCSCCDFRIALV